MFCKTWEVIPLSNAVDFLDNLRKPVTASNRVEGKYSYYGANGLQGTINDYLFDQPLVLLAEDGGHFGNPDRDIAYIAVGKYWVNNHAHVLKPKSGVDLNFLYRVLQRYDVSPFIKGATRAKLTKGDASRIPFPLPPMAEQKRIAAILDKADAIRRKRQQAIELADEFLRSVFLDMFGDPVTNPKGLSVIKLGDLCNKITDGTHHSPPIVEVGIPYITAKHLKSSGLEFFKNPWYISNKSHKEIYARCAPEKHDVLYIKDGATTGLAAINEYDFEFSMLSSLALLKPDRKVLLPEYLCMFLNHPRSKLMIIANMAGAAITRLTLAKIKDINVPIASIESQKEFADIYWKVKVLLKKVANGANLTQEQFSSLSQKAFSGEL